MPTVASRTLLDADNHDLYLDATGQIATGTDTKINVAQAIKCRLQTVQGEDYMNPDLGIPLFDQVLVKNPNLPALQHLFASEIAKVDGVKEVNALSLRMDNANRTLVVTFNVTATDGTVVAGSV